MLTIKTCWVQRKMSDSRYQKICFNIPTAYVDEVLELLESDYAIFPVEETSCNKTNSLHSKHTEE